MVIRQDILKFIEDFGFSVQNLNEETELEKDLGLTGDDFHHFIETYSKYFEVNMEEYLWYFHTEDEGFTLIGPFFNKPPYKLVKRLPIDIGTLFQAAQKKKWHVDYPDHQIPKHRYDIWELRIISVILVVVLIYFTALK